jgi:predicted lipoprotein with Yx(FWY)xxD motif
MRPALIALFCASALALAACGDDDEDTTAATTEAAATAEAPGEAEPESGQASKPKPKPEPGTKVTSAPSDYGTILWGPGEQAIYLFDKETSDRSECYGDCAAAWPPVLTDGDPQASGGVDQKLLGTTERDDGETQVTYGGHPLYYYVDDPPGVVLCHNVSEFGGLWLVVDPEGDAVQ